MWSILGLSLFYSAFAGGTTLRGRILAEAIVLSIIMAHESFRTAVGGVLPFYTRPCFFHRIWLSAACLCAFCDRAAVVSAALCRRFRFMRLPHVACHEYLRP